MHMLTRTEEPNSVGISEAWVSAVFAAFVISVIAVGSLWE